MLSSLRQEDQVKNPEFQASAGGLPFLDFLCQGEYRTRPLPNHPEQPCPALRGQATHQE